MDDKWTAGSPGDGMVPVSAPLPLPELLQPMSEHRVLVFMRTRQASSLNVKVAISYENAEGCSLTYKGSFGVTGQEPWKPRFRVFTSASEATSASTGDEGSKVKGKQQQLNKLVAGKRTVLHVQLENPTAHRLQIRSVALKLDGERARFSFHRGDAAAATSCSSLDPSSDASSPTALAALSDLEVDLAPGERYSAQFHVTPSLSGQLSLGQLQVSWARCLARPRRSPRVYSTSSPKHVVRQRANTIVRHRTGSVGGGDIYRFDEEPEFLLEAMAEGTEREEARLVFSYDYSGLNSSALQG